MATAEEIEAAVTALSTTLRERCPHVAPAIFLNGATPKSIEDLCVSSKQKEQVKAWQSRQAESSYSFLTEVHYGDRKIRINNIKMTNEVDAKLTRLEDMLRMLVLGSEDELMVLMSRFFEVNGYGGSIPEYRHIFNEVYDLAYSIKTLVRYEIFHLRSEA
jgi:hypothetical protein